MAGPSHVALSSIESFPIDQESSYFVEDNDQDVQWNNINVPVLISLVEQHWEEFYDKRIKKKALWRKIADEMRANNHMCSADDCDKKWRNLKKSYVAVLIKQTLHGDFMTKFPHFEQIHNFMRKDIDPLGMREQTMKKTFKNDKFLPISEINSFPFNEFIIDGTFEWSDESIDLLIDLILEHKFSFEVSKKIDLVWESIAKKMNENNFNVKNAQCQRKWINLTDGFRHHQNVGESSGIEPTWTYYNRVKNVIAILNVPLTHGRDIDDMTSVVKNSLASSVGIRIKTKKGPTAKRPRMNTSVDSEEEDIETQPDPSIISLNASLRQLEGCLKMDKKMQRVEEKAQGVARQKRAMAQTHHFLGAILGELKHINKTIEKNRSPHKPPDELIEGVSFDETPIVDEEAYNQTLFTMTNLAKLMKQEKDDLIDPEVDPEGVIYVQGS